MSPKYSERYLAAFRYAAELHALQIRKGSEGRPQHEQVPYLAHLMAVSAFVWEGGGDEDQAIAGLLHDALEDQGDKVSYADLVERFGERVAKIVLAATDTTDIPKPPWKQRKREYLKGLKKLDRDAALVIAADKLHNLRSTIDDLRHFGPKVWDRFDAPKGSEDILWYYQKASKRLSEVAPSNLIVRRLRREVRQLEKMLDAQTKAKKKAKAKKAKAKQSKTAVGQSSPEQAKLPVTKVQGDAEPPMSQSPSVAKAGAQTGGIRNLFRRNSQSG